MKNKQELLVEALRSRFEADRTSAVATLQVYLDSAAGIGEHPQIVDEMAKQVEILAAAEDNLEVLERNFNDE